MKNRDGTDLRAYVFYMYESIYKNRYFVSLRSRTTVIVFMDRVFFFIKCCYDGYTLKKLHLNESTISLLILYKDI